MRGNKQKCLERSCVQYVRTVRRRSRRLGRTDKLSWPREPPLTLNVFILFILCVREVEHVRDMPFDETLK